MKKTQPGRPRKASKGRLMKQRVVTVMVLIGLGPSRTRGQFQICSGQIRLEIG